MLYVNTLTLMKQKTLLIGFLFLFILSSCNNREKKEQALRNLDMAQQKLVDLTSTGESFNQQLIDLKGELEVAKDRLNRAKDFKFLRAGYERDQQIRDASAYIISTEGKIEMIKQMIAQNNVSIKSAKNEINNLKEILKN
jgi:chromosome segregation ATPase